MATATEALKPRRMTARPQSQVQPETPGVEELEFEMPRIRAGDTVQFRMGPTDGEKWLPFVVSRICHNSVEGYRYSGDGQPISLVLFMTNVRHISDPSLRDSEDKRCWDYTDQHRELNRLKDAVAVLQEKVG